MNARGIPPRRVVSTPSVVLPGPRYPPPGGYPDLGTPRGVPGPQYPPPGGRGVPGPPLGGVPGPRYPPPRGGTRTSVPLPPGGTRTSVPPGGGEGGTQTSVPPPPPGGVPGPWYPPGGVPGPRYPPGGYPNLGPPGGTRTSVPRGGGYPDLGTPPLGGGTRTSVPPRGGSGYPPSCLMVFWEMLQSIMGYGYPPPVDRQIDGWTDACQNITFPRTTYAGGNNVLTSQMILTRLECRHILNLKFPSSPSLWT